MYSIDDPEHIKPPAKRTHYRPTHRELIIVAERLGGEPGNPNWRRLINMALHHSSISVGELWHMTSKKIVALLGRGDPATLRQAEMMRNNSMKQYKKTLTAVTRGIADALEQFEQRHQHYNDIVCATGTTHEPDVNAERIAHKPYGWTKAELVKYVSESLGCFSESTFDRIRKAAGLPAAPRDGRGAHRRYSHSDVEKLIDAVTQGNYRRKSEIATAFDELIHA